MAKQRNTRANLAGLVSASALGLFAYLLIPGEDKEVPSVQASVGMASEGRASIDPTPMPVNSASSSATVAISQNPGAQETNSLQGTNVDGSITWDQQGQLQPDLALRQVFDYFLALVGEETEQQIRQRLRAHVEQLARASDLGMDAVEQVMAVYEDYLSYKMALDQVEGHDGSIAGASAAVRRQWEVAQAQLGPELADAFFAEDRAFNQVALEYLSLVRQGESDPEGLQQAMTSLLLEQPGSLATEILASSAPALVQSKVEQLQQAGATELEIWQLRQQVLGEEAANRLAELDRKHQHWDARYQQYVTQKQQIEAAKMSPQDQRSAIEQLRLNLFDPREARRVEALEAN